MDLFSNLTLGFTIAFTPFNLLMAFLGVILGTLIGAKAITAPTAAAALIHEPVCFRKDLRNFAGKSSS